MYKQAAYQRRIIKGPAQTHVDDMAAVIGGLANGSLHGSLAVGQTNAGAPVPVAALEEAAFTMRTS